MAHVRSANSHRPSSGSTASVAAERRNVRFEAHSGLPIGTLTLINDLFRRWPMFTSCIDVSAAKEARCGATARGIAAIAGIVQT